MHICEKHHKDVGREVRIKKEFFSIYPHSKFKRGRILKVSGDLRFVKFDGRNTPIWINVTLLERDVVHSVGRATHEHAAAMGGLAAI